MRRNVFGYDTYGSKQRNSACSKPTLLILITAILLLAYYLIARNTNHSDQLIKIVSNNPSNYFRILQFNIRNANLAKKDKQNKWENRLPLIIKFIEEYNPSVIAIQELVVKSLNDLQTYLPLKYNIIYASRQPLNEYGNENNIWNEMMSIVWDNTQLDLISFGKFSLCDTPQAFPCKFKQYKSIKWYRIALWGLFRLKSNGLHMLFVSTHLHGQAKDDIEINNKQFNVIQNQIYKIINESAVEPLIIISADWNSYQYGKWWKYIINNNTHNYIKWVDPIDIWLKSDPVYHSWNVNYSYHGWDGNKYNGKWKDGILDWFLISDKTMNVVQIKNIQAITSYKILNKQFVYLSDHYPVLMDIDFLM